MDTSRNARTAARRRRGIAYLAVTAVLVGMLAHYATEHDTYRAFVATVVLVCCLGVRREFIYGGLR